MTLKRRWWRKGDLDTSCQGCEPFSFLSNWVNAVDAFDLWVTKIWVVFLTWDKWENNEMMEMTSCFLDELQT
jgi:hypothetical protein